MIRPSKICVMGANYVRDKKEAISLLSNEALQQALFKMPIIQLFPDYRYRQDCSGLPIIFTPDLVKPLLIG